MSKKSEYKKLPLRVMPTVQEVFERQKDFSFLILEILLLGFSLNLFASVTHQIMQFFQVSLLVQISVGILLLIFSSILVTKRIFRPIIMRTTFYTGVLAQQKGTTWNFFRPGQENPRNVQTLLSNFSSQTAFQFDIEGIGDALQYLFFVWYGSFSSMNWLPVPRLIALGSQLYLGVEEVKNQRVIIPSSLKEHGDNKIFEGNFSVPHEISVPEGTLVSVEKEFYGAEVPHLTGKPKFWRIRFDNPALATISIEIVHSGYSSLRGRESALPAARGFPEDLALWYSLDYFVSASVEVQNSIWFRLGMRKGLPKPQHIFVWCKGIIEGLEKDFCYPLKFSEQYVDWNF